MRSWTKSACVVLAWSILPVIVMAGPKGSVYLTQASTRTSNTEIILTSTLSVTAPNTAATDAATAAASHAARYVVRDGDTLSSIAAEFGVRGGWSALYAANRHAIGPDPNVIHAGTVLVLPGQMAPTHYTVQAGDTLSSIAAELGVRGGWPALYAANGHAIGPDPNVIQAGTVLTVPGTAPAPPPTPPARARPRPHPPAPRPAARPYHRPQLRPAPAAAGMPAWLKTLLLAVGLLIVGAFAAEPLLAAHRRWRQARAQGPARALAKVPPVELPGSRRTCAQRAHIILADHDRLVVTRSRRDDTVYVLRPPGADPRAILRVARLVVPESRYGELAEALGIPASWPMD